MRIVFIPFVCLAVPLAAQDDAPSTPLPPGVAPTTACQPSVLAATGPGTGYELDIVYYNQPGHPTNVVPGLGLPFDDGGGSSDAFRRPWFSNDGAHWIIEADADTGSTADDNVYLLDGTLLLQEGQPAAWAPAGELVGTLDDRVAVNDAGHVLMTNNTGGTAPSTADDYVVLIDSGITVLAKEGELVDPILPALAGATWDDSLTCAGLTDTGLAYWEADGVDGTPGGTADDEILVLGTAIHLQEGFGPGGLSGAPAVWENFDADDFYVNGDATIVLVQGDTDGLSTEDDVLARNNVVVLQEGYPIPGGPFAEPIDDNGIVGSWLDAAGNWYARGNNDTTEQDWVVRNGVVVATSDVLDEIVPGSGEHWDDTDFGDCFFAHDGNAAGAYVIGGVTDAASEANGVLVVDDGAGNRFVAVRENDPIDVDGNGLFDDDRFFNTFGNDDVVLLDDGSLWFVATVEDGLGTAVDQGFFRIHPCGWSTYGVGVSPVNVLDLSGDGSTSIGGVFLAVTSGVTGSATATGISLGEAALPLFGGVALISPVTLITVVVTVPVGGTATQPVPIPPQVSLIGVDTYFQSAADDGTMPAGIALSNGMKVTICE
jgi:hypothetical protein